MTIEIGETTPQVSETVLAAQQEMSVSSDAVLTWTRDTLVGLKPKRVPSSGKLKYYVAVCCATTKALTVPSKPTESDRCHRSRKWQGPGHAAEPAESPWGATAGPTRTVGRAWRPCPYARPTLRPPPAQAALAAPKSTLG